MTCMPLVWIFREALAHAVSTLDRSSSSTVGLPVEGLLAAVEMVAPLWVRVVGARGRRVRAGRRVAVEDDSSMLTQNDT